MNLQIFWEFSMHIINIDLSLKLSCLKNTAVFVDNNQRRICPYSDWSTKFKINSQLKVRVPKSRACDYSLMQ